MIARMLSVAFAQALCTGAVSAAIYSGQWIVIFVAAFALNLLWWSNVGNRIDLHGKHYIGILYALVFAVGMTIGAWLWR